MSPSVATPIDARLAALVAALGVHALAFTLAPVRDAVARELARASVSFVEIEALAPELEPTPLPAQAPAERSAPAPSRQEPARELAPEAATPSAPEAATPPVEQTPTPVVEAPAPLAEGAGTLSVDAPVGSGEGPLSTGSTTGATEPSSGAASGASVGSGAAGVDLRGLARGYRASIQAALGRLPPLRGVREPIAAHVIVGIRIDAQGHVLGVRLLRTSGHAVVDEHVLAHFRTVHRLPAPPPELQLETRELSYRVDVNG